MTMCANDGCVNIVQDGDHFVFSSTIAGNDDQVRYTAAEVAAFIEQVNAGDWDDTYRAALAARDREAGAVLTA